MVSENRFTDEALFPTSHTSSSSSEETAWATADLILQLLIIFVLGVAFPSVLFESAGIDKSMTQGPDDAHTGRELTFEFFLLAGASPLGHAYRLVLDSAPRAGERREVTVEGSTELRQRVRELEGEIDRLLDTSKNYRVRRIFVAPREAAFENVLQSYRRLRILSPGDWYLSTYETLPSREQAESMS